MMTNSISPVVRLVDDDYTVLDALTVLYRSERICRAGHFSASQEVGHDG